MKKIYVILGLALFWAFAGGSAFAANKVTVPERSLGKADAPVVIQEFVSFGCPHCAAFYSEILPDIEKNYVDTGKVRIILRDYPIDGPSLRAAALARCMPEEQYFPFVKVLFANQQAWNTGDPGKVLIQYAKLGGLSEDKAKACLDDQSMLDAIVALQQELEAKYKIGATPSFVFNDGAKTITGGQPYPQFVAVIDPLLAQAKK